MFDILTLVEVALGPLLVARVPHLQPAPGGIVVSPTAPQLDMFVDGPAGQITSQRPQPNMRDDASMVVTMEPSVLLSSPEALDRIAAALDAEPGRPIAVYPWHKTIARYEALSTFFVLASAMTTGAFSVLGAALKPARRPTALVASRRGATGEARVFGGGHIVAERTYPNGVRELVDGWTERMVTARAAHPLALLATIFFFMGAAVTAARLVAHPTWAHFGWYAAYVFSISVCLRQLGKFARLATLIYPVTLVFFFAITLRASLTMRGERARAARASRRADASRHV